MSGRWSIFQHGEIRIVLSRLAWILTQSLDSEVRKAESFDFRNVNGRITVDEICWRTMCLVSGNRTMAMCPLSPDGGEIVEEEVTESLSVVHHHLLVSVHELVKAFFETVTSSALEFLEEICGVVSFAHFIGIIEECMRIRRLCPLESLADMVEIILHAAAVEMVYHVALSSRSGAFHHHHSVFLPQSEDAPIAFAELLLLSGKRHEISLPVISELYEGISLGSVLLSLESVDADELRVLRFLCWRSHFQFLYVLII